jgi:hypothetical protein
MTTEYAQLEQHVIDLHMIAHQVEQDLGSGLLSADIRRCADRLHALLKPVSGDTTQ